MRDVFEQIWMHVWMVVHRRWVALGAAALTCLLGWAGMMLIDDQYLVQSKVYLNTQSVLEPLLEGIAVDDKVREQSAAIIQRTMMTQENLEAVIQKTDLRTVAADPKRLEKVVHWLANTIQFDSAGVAVGRDQQEFSNIYSVSFRDKDPAFAKQVVDAVLQLFLQRVQGSSQQDSQVATVFLDQQISEYLKKLEIAEEELKQFKLANPGLVPEPGVKTYRDRVDDVQLQLEQAKVTLREAEYRAQAFRGQLQAAQAASFGVPAAAGGGPTAVDIRIQNLETRLSEQLSSFTEQHPDVVATRRQLTEAQAQKRSGVSSPIPIVANAAADAGVMPLKLMLAQTEAEAAALRDRISDYERQLAQMKPLSQNVPRVEAELAKLSRDYNIVKETYGKLVQRREAANLSAGAKETGDTSVFKIIEPPRIPLVPYFPNRQMLSSVVLLAAIVVGISIAWIRAQSNAAFYSRQQLAEFTDLPVLGTVTMNWSFLEIARRRVGLIMFGMLSLALLASYVWQMAQHGLDVQPILKAVPNLKQFGL